MWVAKPAGVLIGFKSEDDWFDYRLENNPRFLEPVERARESIRPRGARVNMTLEPQAVAQDSEVSSGLRNLRRQRQ